MEQAGPAGWVFPESNVLSFPEILETPLLIPTSDRMDLVGTGQRWSYEEVQERSSPRHGAGE